MCLGAAATVLRRLFAGCKYSNRFVVAEESDGINLVHLVGNLIVRYSNPLDEFHQVYYLGDALCKIDCSRVFCNIRRNKGLLAAKRAPIARR